jgi:hypothetical protein
MYTLTVNKIIKNLKKIIEIKKIYTSQKTSIILNCYFKITQTV